MKYISVIALWCAACLFLSCSQAGDEARRQAEAHYRAGVAIMAYEVSTERPGEATHYERALEHFELAMAADSTFGPAYAAAVVPYYAPYWQRWDDSTKSAVEKKSRWALDKAMSLAPDLPETRTAEAVLAMIEGDYARAEELFKNVVEEAPDYWDAHREYSSLLARSGRYEEALAEAQRAHELDPRAIYGCTVVATAYQGLGRMDEAEAAVRACMESTPDSWEIPAWLGDLLAQKRDYAAMLAVCDKALAEGKTRPWIHNNRVFALAMTGDLEGALEGWQATESKGGIAWAQARMGNREEAEEGLESIRSDIANGQWGMNFAGGFISIALGDTTSGIDFLETWVQALEAQGPGNAVQGQWLDRAELFDPVRGNPRFEALIRRTGHVPAG